MKTVAKYGSIRVKLHEDGAFYCAYWSPVGERMVYRRAGTRQEADVLAKQLDVELRRGNQTLVRDRVEIRDALVQAIKYSRSRDARHRKNLAKCATYFLRYLSGSFPLLKHWDEIRPQHVRGWIDSLEHRGLSAKTAKNYAAVVTMTSRHWHRDEPELYRVLEVVHPFTACQPRPEKNYLDAVELMQLLEVALEDTSRVGLLAVLFGGFGGLNLKEVAGLAPQDINMTLNTMTIRQAKNNFRLRTIPMLPMVADRYRRLFNKPLAKQIVTPRGGGLMTETTLSRAVSRRLLPVAAERFSNSRFLEVAPKDLRKSFVNLMVQAGVPLPAAQAYVGHAGTTLERHYADYGRMDYLEREVVGRVHNLLESMQHNPATVFNIADVN